MNQQTLFLFSGQGSQYYQMGRMLFEQNAIFRHWMKTADLIFQDLTGLSVLQSLYHPDHVKSLPFSRTLLTHPAIFMFQHALGQVLLSHNITPTNVLGTSLGEFSAAVFAEMMSFETALCAVTMQAKMLEDYCSSGGMLAILDDPKRYENKSYLYSKTELAAINFHSGFVISGRSSDLHTIASDLKLQQISCQALPVSHAFHSSFIDEAAEHFLDFINQEKIQKPTVPFISCLQPQQNISAVSGSHFWDIVRQTIQLQKTISRLETENSYHYIDLSPTGTLATIVKYNLHPSTHSTVSQLMTPMTNNLNALDLLLNS
jgi:trans-AT polyketide synthase/acyltransferase/oxidoreductase domain-containing protein